MHTSINREAERQEYTPDADSPAPDATPTPSSGNAPSWIFRIIVPLALLWLLGVIVLRLLGVYLYSGAAGSN